MAADLKIKVNEQSWTVTAAADTPLLYVLSNEMNLQGPRFGCGLGQCSSCSVLVNGDGAGEEVMAGAAAAIAKAFFDATGVRMSQFPFTPARGLAALGRRA